MLYQRSMEIERRLEAALALIRSGEYSTPMLAEKLGVSIPTVSRHVTALRERGHTFDPSAGKGAGGLFSSAKLPMDGRRLRITPLLKGDFTHEARV
jgi:DNA-binding MarR family transcriptional regulator